MTTFLAQPPRSPRRPTGVAAIDWIASLLVRRPNGCWEWTGSLTRDSGKDQGGYGRFRRTGDRSERVHVIVFEHFHGPVPAGLVLDHLCRNRACANPLHLEAVTHRENALRGHSPAVIAHITKVCLKGHDRSDIPDRRGCRVCHREWLRAKRAADPKYGRAKRADRTPS